MTTKWLIKIIIRETQSWLKNSLLRFVSLHINSLYKFTTYIKEIIYKLKFVYKENTTNSFELNQDLFL